LLHFYRKRKALTFADAVFPLPTEKGTILIGDSRREAALQAIPSTKNRPGCKRNGNITDLVRRRRKRQEARSKSMQREPFWERGFILFHSHDVAENADPAARKSKAAGDENTASQTLI